MNQKVEAKGIAMDASRVNDLHRLHSFSTPVSPVDTHAINRPLSTSLTRRVGKSPTRSESEEQNLYSNDDESIQSEDDVERISLRRNSPSRSPDIRPNTTKERIFHIYRSLCRICASRVLLISLSLQALQVLVATVLDSHFAYRLICQFLQIGVLLLAINEVISRLTGHRHLSLGFLLRLFLSVMLAFAGFYTFAYLENPKTSFALHGADRDNATHSEQPTAVFISMLYFSATTFSGCGLGDVAPLSNSLQLLAICQMLAAVMFTLGVFALGLAYFRLQARVGRRRRSTIPSVFAFATPPRTYSHVQRNPDVSRASSRAYQVASEFYTHFFTALEQNMPCCRGLTQLMIKYPLAVTLTVQLLVYLLVVFIDDDVFKRDTRQLFVAIIVTVMEGIQFINVLGVSLDLVQKLNAAEVTAAFLAQSYCCTIILFAGVYFALFLLQGPDSFQLPEATLTESDVTLSQLVFHLLYFSTSLQTTTCYGDLFARSSLTRLIVTFHLVVAVVYSTLILGMGMANLVDRLEDQLRKQYAEARGSSVGNPHARTAVIGVRSLSARVKSSICDAGASAEIEMGDM